jgi:hypothetical protein
MAGLDRNRLIAMLNGLGAESDDAALATAREVHRTIAESGLTWDDLLLADERESDGDDTVDDEVAREEDEDETAEPVAADRQEEARIIDGLLARPDISDITRQELTDLKRDIAGGGFDETDSRYVHALAKRLGSAG